ncbi:6836_t:CDS:2, partial [Acaulospora colombiana]
WNEGGKGEDCERFANGHDEHGTRSAQDRVVQSIEDVCEKRARRYVDGGRGAKEKTRVVADDDGAGARSSKRKGRGNS